MFDAANARRLMVEGQVRTADVSDPICSMLWLRCRARSFCRLRSRRWLISTMTYHRQGPGAAAADGACQADPSGAASGGDRVLDVACGTGYSSAVLARLAGSVVALEDDADLARGANEALASVGANAVEVMVGPLSAGWPAAGALRRCLNQWLCRNRTGRVRRANSSLMAGCSAILAEGRPPRARFFTRRRQACGAADFRWGSAVASRVCGPQIFRFLGLIDPSGFAER